MGVDFPSDVQVTNYQLRIIVSLLVLVIRMLSKIVHITSLVGIALTAGRLAGTMATEDRDTQEIEREAKQLQESSQDH